VKIFHLYEVHGNISMKVKPLANLCESFKTSMTNKPKPCTNFGSI